MPPRPFVNDALWRCLCPGFPPGKLVQSSFQWGAKSARRAALGQVAASPRFCPQWRAYGASTAPSPASEPFPSGSDSAVLPFQTFDAPPPLRNTRNKVPLAKLSTPLLYEHARIAGAEGRFEEVMNICRVLVKDRAERINKEMYTALLHSFVSARNGTVGKLRKLLDDMGFWSDDFGPIQKQDQIELDLRGCECALEVLAVHPDHLLRIEILDYMKSRWFNVSDRAQNFVVAGLLRDRHFEHALEMLDGMVSKKVKVESWLFDKAIWTLLEFKEVEEAFYVLTLKEATQANGAIGSATLSNALWGSLLDAASQKQLLVPARIVWNTQVQPGYLRPATGTCLSVLALAARYGDVPLATDTLRVLTERQPVLTMHHYELLITTYLNASDLSAALSVILIMVDSNIKVDAGTCHPLFLYLANEELGEASRPMKAFTSLQDFDAAGRKVPTSAINACIQASISLNRLEEAIEFYKVLHTVSHAGPDTHTFNLLFKGCHMAVRKELAMFLANEMVQLGLKPDNITYDRLILVCIVAGDLTDALLYYQEMRAASMKPRQKTWEVLIVRSAMHGDARAVAILKEYEETVDEPRKSVVQAVMLRFDVDRLPAEGSDGKGPSGEGANGKKALKTEQNQGTKAGEPYRDALSELEEANGLLTRAK